MKLKNACVDILARHGLQPGQATPLVFIDGYDECRVGKKAPGNLARRLGLPADAKLIVTCRPGAVPEDELRKRFAFRGQLQSCHYLSFNTSELLAYLKQHLAWDDATYRNYAARLQGADELRAVLRNPFVLYLLWQSWATVSRKPLEELTRADIYDGFIEHMVSSQQGLLEGAVLRQLQAGHASLPASFQAYANETALLAAQGESATLALSSADKTGSPWANLSALVQQEAQQRYRKRQARLAGMSAEEKKEAARRMVLTEEDLVRLCGQKAAQLASALPLRPRAQALEFIHKSVFEHCLAQRLVSLLAEDAQRIEEAALRALLGWATTASPEALMMVRAQLAAMDAVRGASGKDASARQRCIEAMLLAAIGKVLYDREAFAEALACQHRALAIREKALGAAHPYTASSYHEIGLLLHKQGKLDPAMDYYRKALAIWEEVPGAWHSFTAKSYHNIGALLRDQGKLGQAMESYRKALAIKEKVLGTDHISTASTYNGIGALLHDQGKLEQALEHYSKALRINEKVRGTDHSATALSYNNIGMLLKAQGKLDQALDYYRKALAIWEKVLGADHTSIALSCSSIGLLLHDQGKHDQALEAYRKALAIREKVLGVDHTSTAQSYLNIGVLLQAQGDLDQALECYRKALAINKKVLGAEHSHTVTSHSNIGALLWIQGKPDQALESYHKVLAIQEKVFGANHTDTATSYHYIGLLLHDLGKPDQALESCRKALVIREKVLGTDPATATSCNRVGEMLQALSDKKQALGYYKKALAIATELGDPAAEQYQRNIESLMKSKQEEAAQEDNRHDSKSRKPDGKKPKHKVPKHKSADYKNPDRSPPDKKDRDKCLIS